MSAAERGVTTVADRAAAKIVRQAAAEAAGQDGVRVLRSSAVTRGRRVEVSVELDMPLSAPAETGRMVSLRDHLTRRTRDLTGLTVAPASLRVRKLGPLTPRPQPQAEQQPVTAARVWAPRRSAATGLALAVAGLSALTLWTILHEHLPGIAAQPWGQVRQWMTVPGGGPLVRPAALAAAVGGGWLILLALTPGHRRLLLLGCPRPAQAVISRKHAARLVRAAVTEVPGLRVRAVRLTSRRVTVRAEAAYGAPQAIHDTAIASIERTLQRMALRGKPDVKLVLRPARHPGTAADRPPREEGNA